MSTTHDDIPFDIQTEIIKRIPDVKALIRFRSVSKPWKSLIDSSKFISAYKSSNHQILVTSLTSKENYLVSVVNDDDSFSQHNFPIALTNLVEPVFFLGSSQGLFCIHNIEKNSIKDSVAIIWNPSIRKSVTVRIPIESSQSYYGFGFGVCPRTNDPKLVYLKQYYARLDGIYNIFTTSADIFTLSSGVWRTQSINLSTLYSVSFPFYMRDEDHQTVIDGILYLHITTYKFNVVNDEYNHHNQIITFDLTSEEFGECCLPDKLATSYNLSISKLNESLVVCQCYYTTDAQFCDVWRMEHGFSKLFEKLFTIKAPFRYIVKGFRMNGQTIIEATGANRRKKGILQVYDPCNGKITVHDLKIGHRVFCRGRYTPTLLLLNQSVTIIH